MENAILILVSLVSIAICRAIAEKRGANTLFWTIMGALFGPFAIPFSFLSKPQQRP
ncbi:MAG: hypothetical protein ABIK68_09650 [bacterium]